MQVTLENPTIRVVLNSGLKITVTNIKYDNLTFEFMEKDLSSINSVDIYELETLTGLLDPNNNEVSLAAVSETGETIIDMYDINVLFT